MVDNSKDSSIKIEKIKLLSVGVVVHWCHRPSVSSSVCKEFLPE
jgi:hypothetical protein